jgi:hypothetical protein
MIDTKFWLLSGVVGLLTCIAVLIGKWLGLRREQDSTEIEPPEGEVLPVWEELPGVLFEMAPSGEFSVILPRGFAVDGPETIIVTEDRMVWVKRYRNPEVSRNGDQIHRDV